MHLSPRVVRGGLGGAGPSEERAATSNSSWGPVSYRLMGVAARDGRVVQLPSPAPRNETAESSPRRLISVYRVYRVSLNDPPKGLLPTALIRLPANRL